MSPTRKVKAEGRTQILSASPALWYQLSPASLLCFQQSSQELTPTPCLILRLSPNKL